MFAEEVRAFVRQLPRTISNAEDVEAVGASLGVRGGNCIEGNEALGDKDRVMKFRTCRKDAKECELWLRLVYTAGDVTLLEVQRGLRREAHELKLIFSSIVKKLE